MKRHSACLAVVLTVSGGCGFDSGAIGEAPPAQTGRRTIAVQPTGADLFDFPLAVVIEADAEIAARAQHDGRDLLFTDENLDVLPYEIEHYDAGSGALVAWVRVPEIDAANGARLLLHFDDPEASDQQNVAEVWSAGFAGVWHLSTPSVAMTIADSAGNLDDGRAPASVVAPEGVAGIAGGGLSFSGPQSDTIRIADPAGALDFGMDSYSVSMWVKVDSSLGAGDAPWSNGGASPAQNGYAIALGQNEWEVQLVSSGLTKQSRFGFESTFLGRWVNLVAVVDRDLRELRTYADGRLAQLMPLDILGPIESSVDATLGGVPSVFNGSVDEIRVFRGALDFETVQASYTNLAAPNELVSVE